MSDADHILSPGPHLLIDDHLIEQSRGLVRTTHRPEKLAAPVVGTKGGADQPIFSVKVVHDSERGLFRMWYNSIRVSGPPPSHHYEVSYRYTESEDGINWRESEYVEKPHPDHFDVNLFLLDEGVAHRTPSERYKMATFAYVAGVARGMWVSHSADGIRFTSYPRNPVIPFSVDDTPPGKPGHKNIILDIIDGCWDPLKKEYLLGCGVGEGGYPGKAIRNFEGRRRCVGMSKSKDFVNWETPRIIVRPDPNNDLEEFYGFKPMVRGDLYLGFPRVLHDEGAADPDLPLEGVGWTELMTSRDGKTWVRYQDKFLDRNPVAGTYDHAMAWFGDCIQVGDKEYIYYAGYSEGHKRGDRQMGLGTLRKNGFVSRDAGAQGGTFRTPLVALKGDDLTVNARVKGELRLRLLNGRNEPIEGFDWPDCSAIRGDSVRHRVRWSRPLSTLRARPLSMEYSLRETQLYGWDLA